MVIEDDAGRRINSGLYQKLSYHVLEISTIPE